MDRFHPLSISVFFLGLFLFLTLAGDLLSIFFLFLFFLTYSSRRRSFLLLFFLVLFFHLLFRWSWRLEDIVHSLASSFRLISFLSFVEAMFQFLSKEGSFFLVQKTLPKTALFFSMVFFELKRLERRIESLRELGHGPKEILLHLLSYAGEEGLIRAQMMERRGFGLKKRSTYLQYSFHKRDLWMVFFVLFSLVLFFLGYRFILPLYLFLPLLIQFYEDLLWHISL